MRTQVVAGALTILPSFSGLIMYSLYQNMSCLCTFRWMTKQFSFPSMISCFLFSNATHWDLKKTGEKWTTARFKRQGLVTKTGCLMQVSWSELWQRLQSIYNVWTGKQFCIIKIPFLKFSNNLYSILKNGKVNLQQYKDEIFYCENIVG